MDLGRLSVPQRISAVSIIVVALSAFLPWVSIFGISAIGLEGDGVLTLILAIGGAVTLALSSGLVGAPKLSARVAAIILTVLSGLVALIALIDMNGAAAIGLYLTLFGGFAWVAGAVWQLVLVQQGSDNGAGPA